MEYKIKLTIENDMQQNSMFVPVVILSSNFDHIISNSYSEYVHII
mgnify:FL=1